MIKLSAIAALALTAAIAVPAAAQTADPVAVTISVEDLDLNTAEGQASLESRVDQAISRACRTGGRDIASRNLEAACRADLEANFAPRVELAIAEARTERLATLTLDNRG